MLLWVAALTLGLTVDAQAGSWRELSSTLEAQAGAWGAKPAALQVPVVPRARAVPSQGGPASPGLRMVVAVEPLLNRSWLTPITFQAGALTIHVSGMKSSNGEKNWFLSLCVDPCVSPQFYRGRDLLRYRPMFSPVAVLNGSEIVDFAGRRYKLSIEGQLRHREESRIQIEPLDKTEPKREWRAKDIADAVFQGGYPLVLNGRNFRLLYVQEILENESGGFAGFSPDRAFVFMTLDQGRYVAYGFKAKDIPRDHVEAFIRAPSSTDDKPQEKVPAGQLLRVGLRLDENGQLEVYDPSRLPAR